MPRRSRDRSSGRSPGAEEDHVRLNRRRWERGAAAYERMHRRSLRNVPAESWGLFRLSEHRLGLLGSVRGQRVLELGCGAALWSASLARRGATVVGIDFSAARLRQAAAELEKRDSDVRLVRADAERLPFAAGSFDLAFCDWGALTFADPDRTVPEAARVLRPGGRLVFSTANPVRDLFEDRWGGPIGRRLRREYFDLGRIQYRGEVNFQRPFGRWVELFRSSGLSIDRLVEPQAPARSRSSYLTAEQRAWGQRWPLEAIWSLRREPRSGPNPTVPVGRRSRKASRTPPKARRPPPRPSASHPDGSVAAVAPEGGRWGRARE